MINLYEILEVEKDATTREIKVSYYKLSKMHHPDKGGDSEKFHKIVLAYEILSDEAKRTKYDNGEDVFNMTDPESFIKQRVTALFFQVMSLPELDYKTSNIFKMLKDQVFSSIKTLKVKIDTAKEAMIENDDLASRISGENSEFFIGVINHETEKIRKGIEKMKSDIKLAEDVVTFIDKIDYKFEEKEEANPWERIRIYGDHLHYGGTK